MGAPYLEGKQDYRPLVLMRLNRQAPQASKDAGRTWIDGEKLGEAWVFAFDNETLSLFQADASIQPGEFKAWAMERATITKSNKGYQERLVPYFHSAVAVAAFGRNEMQGILKFPGTDFVVPFRGIRFKDHWVARSLHFQPFNTYTSHFESGTFTYRGSRALKTDDRLYLQLEFHEDRLQMGTGSYINYGQGGDPVDQLKTAMEFPLAKAVLLPKLAAAYQANIGRSIWTKSDEDASFSREADKAFAEAGLTVGFYEPHWTDNPAGGYRKEAQACLNPMLERLKSLGAKVEFIKP
jgi:hypothetical protein